MNSGDKFKENILFKLTQAGIDTEIGYVCGFKPGTKSDFNADFLISEKTVSGIVCTAYQDVGGTAWEKHVYKYICMSAAISNCDLNFGLFILYNEAEKKSPLRDMEELSKFIVVNPYLYVMKESEFTKLVVRNELFESIASRGLRKNITSPARKRNRPDGYQPAI